MTLRGNTFHRLTLTGASLLALLLLTALLAYNGKAAGALHIFDRTAPGDFSQEASRPVVVTGIIPFDSNDFVPMAANATPSRADARPLAALGNLPQDTTGVAIRTKPFVGSTEPGRVSYDLGTVRYTLKSGSVYVMTVQPTNLGTQRPLDLGRVSGDIGSGRIAYTSSIIHRDGPNLETRHTVNMVSFVDNELVVTVAGEIPVDQLLALAGGVSISGR